jgi:hypothetical protein
LGNYRDAYLFTATTRAAFSAGLAVGAADALLAALFCFDYVKYCAAYNGRQNQRNNNICTIHRYASLL